MERIIKVFAVKHLNPYNDADTAVLCEICGSTRYTSMENLAAATMQGMQITCLDCVAKLMDEKSEDVIHAGVVRDGKVVEGGKPRES